MFTGVLLRFCAAAFLLSASAAPILIPGKEYADVPNKNAANVATPGQSLLWTGSDSTNVSNGWNYSSGTPRQVDALAQRDDAYFGTLLGGGAALIVGISGENTIFFQNPGTLGSGFVNGVASSWLASNSINRLGVNGVGALDLWGPVGVPDAEMYSEVGDPSGCAVLQIGAPCRFTVAELAAAVGVDPIHFDLDGLMFAESFIGVDLPSWHPMLKSHGGKAPSLIFSIAPAPSLTGAMYDGGEIWTYDPVTKTIAFLNHSGRIWNTEFDVRSNFRSGMSDGIINSENITAIEASFFVVPEPGTMGLLAAGLAVLAISRLRR
jgi:uncharacterized membrane protein